MLMINIRQAEKQFFKLIDAALHEEETIIVRAGIPVAKIVPIKKNTLRPEPGLLKGQVTISDDFDDPLPDYLKNYFEDK